MQCASQCWTNHAWPSRLPCTYCAAIFGPFLPTILDILVPCSRLIFAVVLPVASAPAECASSTSASVPASGFGGKGRSIRTESHSDVMAMAEPRRTGRSRPGWLTPLVVVVVVAVNVAMVVVVARTRIPVVTPFEVPVLAGAPMVAREFADLRCCDGCPSYSGRPQAGYNYECRCCAACQCSHGYHHSTECCVPAMGLTPTRW
jgi:hypothetical protein